MNIAQFQFLIKISADFLLWLFLISVSDESIKIDDVDSGDDKTSHGLILLSSSTMGWAIRCNLQDHQSPLNDPMKVDYDMLQTKWIAKCAYD